eukprot:gene48882-biopygen94116
MYKRPTRVYARVSLSGTRVPHLYRLRHTCAAQRHTCAAQRHTCIAPWWMYNAAADTMARRGTELQQDAVPLDLSTVKAAIRAVREQWWLRHLDTELKSSEWEKTGGKHWYREVIADKKGKLRLNTHVHVESMFPKRQPAMEVEDELMPQGDCDDVPKFSRKLERLVTQCRTRWTPLCNDYRQMDLWYPTADCNDCGHTDGVRHLVFNCNNECTSDIRERTLGTNPTMKVFTEEVQKLVAFLREVHARREAQWELQKEEEKKRQEGATQPGGEKKGREAAVSGDTAPLNVKRAGRSKAKKAEEGKKKKKKKEERGGPRSRKATTIDIDDALLRLGLQLSLRTLRRVDTKEGAHAMRQLASKRLADKGYKLRDVVGDGNCQFRSIAHQLARAGVQVSHEDVRRRCVRWLREHKDLQTATGTELSNFAVLPEHPEGVTYDQYLDRMEATSAVRFGRVYWGDHLTLHAAAAEFECNIVLFSTLESWQQPREFRALVPVQVHPAHVCRACTVCDTRVPLSGTPVPLSGTGVSLSGTRVPLSGTPVPLSGTGVSLSDTCVSRSDVRFGTRVAHARRCAIRVCRMWHKRGTPHERAGVRHALPPRAARPRADDNHPTVPLLCRYRERHSRDTKHLLVQERHTCAAQRAPLSGTRVPLSDTPVPLSGTRVSQTVQARHTCAAQRYTCAAERHRCAAERHTCVAN